MVANKSCLPTAPIPSPLVGSWNSIYIAIKKFVYPLSAEVISKDAQHNIIKGEGEEIDETARWGTHISLLMIISVSGNISYCVFKLNALLWADAR